MIEKEASARTAAIRRLTDAIAEGENVKLSGFGIFTVAHKRARRGRNPLTGEDLVIGARRVVVFKASPTLTGGMNGR